MLVCATSAREWVRACVRVSGCVGSVCIDDDSSEYDVISVCDGFGRLMRDRSTLH